MNFLKIQPGTDVYLARDSYDVKVHIFPADVGIRKFHGCIDWGAAWSERVRDCRMSARSKKHAPRYAAEACQRRYGFTPGPGTAYLVEYTPTGRMRKPKQIDIDFSN